MNEIGRNRNRKHELKKRATSTPMNDGIDDIYPSFPSRLSTVKRRVAEIKRKKLVYENVTPKRPLKRSKDHGLQRRNFGPCRYPEKFQKEASIDFLNSRDGGLRSKQTKIAFPLPKVGKEFENAVNGVLLPLPRNSLGSQSDLVQGETISSIASETVIETSKKPVAIDLLQCETISSIASETVSETFKKPIAPISKNTSRVRSSNNAPSDENTAFKSRPSKVLETITNRKLSASTSSQSRFSNLLPTVEENAGFTYPATSTPLDSPDVPAIAKTGTTILHGSKAISPIESAPQDTFNNRLSSYCKTYQYRESRTSTRSSNQDRLWNTLVDGDYFDHTDLVTPEQSPVQVHREHRDSEGLEEFVLFASPKQSFSDEVQSSEAKADGCFCRANRIKAKSKKFGKKEKENKIRHKKQTKEEKESELRLMKIGEHFDEVSLWNFCVETYSMTERANAYREALCLY